MRGQETGGEEREGSSSRILFVFGRFFVRVDHQQQDRVEQELGHTQCQLDLNSLRVLIDTNLQDLLNIHKAVQSLGDPDHLTKIDVEEDTQKVKRLN